MERKHRIRPGRKRKTEDPAMPVHNNVCCWKRSRVEWDENCLQFHNRKRAVLTASHAQVTRQIYTSSLESWKRHEYELKPLIEEINTDATR